MLYMLHTIAMLVIYIDLMFWFVEQLKIADMLKHPSSHL